MSLYLLFFEISYIKIFIFFYFNKTLSNIGFWARRSRIKHFKPDWWLFKIIVAHFCDGTRLWRFHDSAIINLHRYALMILKRKRQEVLTFKKNWNYRECKKIIILRNPSKYWSNLPSKNPKIMVLKLKKLSLRLF